MSIKVPRYYLFYTSDTLQRAPDSLLTPDNVACAIFANWLNIPNPHITIRASRLGGDRLENSLDLKRYFELVWRDLDANVKVLLRDYFCVNESEQGVTLCYWF